MAERLVIGRVTSLEGGRPVVQSPLTPRPANADRIAKLVSAARKFKAFPKDSRARQELLAAALAID